MERIPALAYVHPIWMAATLVLGLYLAGSALPHVGDANFKVRPHDRLGRVFLIMLFAGLVFGKLVASTLPPRTFAIPGHSFLAVVIVALIVVGAVFGYQGGRLRLRTRTGMMQVHPWLVVLTAALMIAQGLLGIGSRGLRLINF
jgi:hypothetical protein